MATVHVTLSRVDDRGDTGGSLPLTTSQPTLVETLTSSGTSAASTIVAPKADGLVWTVKAKGGDVWVNFDTGTPVAASGAGHLIFAGSREDFTVTTNGEKIAVKDA